MTAVRHHYPLEKPPSLTKVAIMTTAQPIFTARSSYACAVLGIVILSIRLSVRHMRAL